MFYDQFQFHTFCRIKSDIYRQVLGRDVLESITFQAYDVQNTFPGD